jgi:hypothetical protein
MYDGGTARHPAAVSRGRSYWTHRFSGSEIENKNHRAGQVQVAPPFWSWGCRDPPKCRFARESRGHVRGRCTTLLRRWRRPAWTLARAAVRPVLGRFAASSRSRRRPGCKPGSAQSGGFETTSFRPRKKKRRRTTLGNRFASLFSRAGRRGAFGLFRFRTAACRQMRVTPRSTWPACRGLKF